MGNAQPSFRSASVASSQFINPNFRKLKMPNEKHYSLNRPEHCSKFEHCSANVCPLDSDWRKRSSGRDEPVCFYLLEVGKPGAKERISSVHGEAIYEIASKVYLELVSTTCPLNTSLQRAKNTPSRIRSIPKAKKQMGVTL